MSAPEETTQHSAASAVCELLYALARAGAWVPTHALAEQAGTQADTARRICRELAARDWVIRRADDGGAEQWRWGPALDDVGAGWSAQMEARIERLCGERDLVAVPLVPYRRVAGITGIPVDGLEPTSITAEHHKAAATVAVLVSLLARAAQPASLGALALATGLHRVTALSVLDTLAAPGWVVCELGETVATWRLGPGIARLSVQQVGQRRAAFSRPT